MNKELEVSQPPDKRPQHNISDREDSLLISVKTLNAANVQSVSVGAGSYVPCSLENGETEVSCLVGA